MRVENLSWIWSLYASIDWKVAVCVSGWHGFVGFPHECVTNLLSYCVIMASLVKVVILILTDIGFIKNQTSYFFPFLFVSWLWTQYYFWRISVRSKCKQKHKFTTKEEIEKWSSVLQNDLNCNQARFFTSIRYTSTMKRLDENCGLRVSVLSDANHHLFNESLTNVHVDFFPWTPITFIRHTCTIFSCLIYVNISLTSKHTEWNYLI